MTFWDKLLRTFHIQPSSQRATERAIDAAADGLDTPLRDAVTGLFNKKHLIYRMSALMSQAARGKDALAVILWDIDGFVDFNNQFGQREGDLFLKKVAEAIRGSLRPYDEAFRVGGDEFCALLMPATDKIANDVMDRVRATVEKNVLASIEQYQGRLFSVSSGAAFFPGEHTLPQALLHAAQQELYKSSRARA
jgi:diguanylate cyclase (GGDEF)-like protein